MATELPPLITPDEQFSRIRAVDSLPKQLSLVREYFNCSAYSNYTRELENYTSRFPGTLRNPDYFGLLALVVTLFTQYGFTSIEGMIDRHDAHYWLKSVFDPRHQLSLACYAGGLNDQIYPTKRAMVEMMNGHYPERSYMLWAARNSAKGGKAVSYWDGKLESLVYEVEYHEKLPERPILMPTRELNRALGNMCFNGVQAENFCDQEIMERVIPAAHRVLAPYLDIRNAFQGSLKGVEAARSSRLGRFLDDINFSGFII